MTILLCQGERSVLSRIGVVDLGVDQNQSLHRLREVVGACHQQRALPLCSGEVYLGSALEQPLDGQGPIPATRNDQRSQAIRGLRIYVGPMQQHELRRGFPAHNAVDGDLLLVVAGRAPRWQRRVDCIHQGRPTCFVDEIDHRLPLQKMRHDLRLCAVRCTHQSSSPISVRHLDICTPAQQLDHATEVPALRGQGQGRLARALSDLGEVCPRGQQLPHDPLVALHGGPGQRREALAVLGPDVRALLEQPPHGVRLALRGRNV
mmetsp:Transcript_26007/g.74453  ORF Transcript_26007/g.74453 Transcript_26007/m.74453 type:complete len:262 (-) Transcript_26007:242-1027(-)